MTTGNVAQRSSWEVEAPMRSATPMKVTRANGFQILYVIALIPGHQLQSFGQCNLLIVQIGQCAEDIQFDPLIAVSTGESVEVSIDSRW